MSGSRWMVLLLLAACSSKSNDMLPVGGGGGGVAGPDAPASADARHDSGTVLAVDAANIAGRVCLVTTDPRALGLHAGDCATTGADNLTVRLGSQVATTSADGTFSIDARDASATAVWHVTGANIATSAMVISDYEIPALTRSLFDSLKTANGVYLLPGQGSLMAQLVRNGAGVSGVAATVAPTAEYAPFYDGSAPTTWQQTSTSTAGVVWVPGIDVGTATITAGTLTSASQPILDDAITFVTLTYP